MKHLKQTFLLAILMSMVGLKDLAAAVQIDGIYYNLNSTAKTASVTKPTSGKYSGSIVIPSSVTRLTTTYSVTSIEQQAFQNCTGLESIVIPNSVTSIGNSVFDGCSGLTSVEIPEGVTSLGSNVFYNCSSLTSVELPNSVTIIPMNAFSGCSSLTSVSLGNSVTSIGSSAFSYCSFTSIEIPNSVTSIGSSAFSSCSNLTSVVIPSSVTSIGNYAFNYCSNLTSVTIRKDTPLTITSNTFSNRTNATLYVSAGSKAAYEAADYWKEFKEIVDDDMIIFADANVKALCVANWDTNGDGELSEAEAAAVTSLGTVFQNNPPITSFDELQYFTGLTSIEVYAFRGCSGLTSIEIPNSVTSIGSDAFRGCSGLTSIEIPNSVTSIGYQAFSSCSNLTSIEIPNSVTSIGYQAFSSCSGLTSIEIPNSVMSIGNYAFRGCSGLTSIIVEQGNTVYDSRNNCNAIIEKSSNKLIVGCKNTIIPNTVTSIEDRAFDYCSGLTSVTIPNSVTSIGSHAFESCSGLTSVEIPNSVTSIGFQAFSSCSNLTSVVIPSSVTSIEGHAFESCSGLTSIIVEQGNTVYDSRNNCNAIIEKSSNKLIVGCKNTIIPNTVTSIGDNAFEGCSGLTSVEIPNSVTSIGGWAFYYCSSLTSIEIPNSVTSIGGGAFQYCTGLTSVTIKKNTPLVITAVTFSNRANATLYVPAGSKAAYEAADYWKEFKEIVELTATVSMSANEIRTYANSNDLDFSDVEGLTAYIISGFSPSTGTLTLTPVTEVPAGEGLLLKGAAGNYAVPYTTTDMVYSNLLTGVTTATTISPTTSTETNFILANGKHGINFYTLSQSGEIAAGKAYLHLPTSALSAHAFTLVFEDEQNGATGIESIENADSSEENDDHYYDLQGRRVLHPGKGIYIKNGKKTLIK